MTAGPGESACPSCISRLDEATVLVTTESGDPDPLLEQVEAHCGTRPGARAVVLRLRGTYQRSLGNLAEAEALLSEARSIALQIGDHDLADEIQLTLAGTLARAGDFDGARALMVEVAERRRDTIGDKARAQIGAMDSFSGEYAAGIEILEGLGDRLQAADEPEWAARALANEGWCLIQLGRVEEAIATLRRCRDLWQSLGAVEAAGRASNHLAVAYSLLGKPLEALRVLRQSWEGRDLKMDDWLDAADLYLQAGLVDDALRDGKAARAAASTRREEGLSDLALARLYVATGHYPKARETANAAVAAFGELGLQDLRFAAAVVEVESRLRTTGPDSSDTDELQPPLGAERTRAAHTAQTLRAELLLASGDIDGAAELIAGLGDEQFHLGMAADLRVRSVAALIQERRGDGGGALETVSNSLRQVGDQALALGATDLTVGMRSLAASLATTGMRIALQLGVVERVFEFTDRLRALDAVPRSTPTPAVNELLGRYRLQRRAEMQSDGAADPERATATEHALRDAIRISYEEGGRSVEPVELATLERALGAASMAMFFESEGDTYLATLDSGGVMLGNVAATAEIEHQAAKVRMRLLAALSSPEEARHHQAGVRRMADRLDELLFGQIQFSDGPLVLIPPPGVFGVPWALLPTLAGRELAINFSPSAWHAAQSRLDRPGGRNVYVAGPEPPEAAGEVMALVGGDPAATSLTDEAATSSAVLRSMDGSHRLHLATHGTARGDNPLFSSLQMSDGPLTLYEMQTVGPPAEVVISACSVGRPRIYRGGLAVGLPAALLAGGSRSVVAAEIPVPDGPTREVMTLLYEHMRLGSNAPAALSAATTLLLEGDPLAGLTAAGFNAYGA